MPASYYRDLPKVDLHRHLEGSLRLETLADIAGQYEIDLPVGDLNALSALVQIQDQDPATPENFLSKFVSLRNFFRSPEIIRRVTREAIADAAADNVRYLELRFTPVALSRIGGFPLEDVMAWVGESAVQAAGRHDVETRLIVSANRHESPALAAEVTRLAAEQGNGIVAVDLAGDEANFPIAPFREVLTEAHRLGFQITLHAGEWDGPQNVYEAIAEYGAQRIGHGVRVLEDSLAVQLAREKGTTFEVCITSNYQSGVISPDKPHPFMAMLDVGLDVTINTDDPGVSGIRLSDEYELACEILGLPRSRLRACVLAAARAAFLPAERKTAVIQRLMEEWGESQQDVF